jgi:dTDP-4-dehydrorhamnose 3,5-epimerase
MRLSETGFENLKLIEVDTQSDFRGDFTRLLCRLEANGFLNDFSFKQLNISYTKDKFTFRGLHLQLGDAAETKIVISLNGIVQDFVIDLRKNSSTFKKVFQIDLDFKNVCGIVVPKGFAHGYFSLTSDVKILYLNDNFYNPSHEISISPFSTSIYKLLKSRIVKISEKDKNGLLLEDVGNLY